MESVLLVDAPYEGLRFRIPKPIQSLISCLRLFGALLRFGLRAQGEVRLKALRPSRTSIRNPLSRLNPGFQNP